MACLSGPFSGGDGGGGGGRDIFADPYLDGPGRARLGLRPRRDPAPRGGARAGVVARHTPAPAVAHHAEASGVRVLEQWAGPGHDVERLAELIALTDFASTYLAIGHGLDPATAPGITGLHLPRKAPE